MRNNNMRTPEEKEKIVKDLISGKSKKDGFLIERE